MKIVLVGILAVSLALNFLLWSRSASQRDELRKMAEVGASEAEELRRENRELQASRATVTESASADMRELARMRNEVSQLRKQVGEIPALRAQAAEAAQLRAQLSATAQNLAKVEGDLAGAAKLQSDQAEASKAAAMAAQCVSNLKQIGLAARIWANEHQGVFPPDFITMHAALATPKVLFCPADAAAVQVTDWAQLNPATISYRFMNPNGNESDPAKVLTTCPTHGHTGLSDGSVHRK